FRGTDGGKSRPKVCRAPVANETQATALSSRLQHETDRMRPIAIRTLLAAAPSIVAATLATAQATPAPAPRPTPMVLTIPAWPDGAQIPANFTQAGEQVSSELKWSNVPPGTQSFVVNMLDPDVAISRGTETQPHWIVWNIPAGATELPEAMKP